MGPYKVQKVIGDITKPLDLCMKVMRYCAGREKGSFFSANKVTKIYMVLIRKTGQVICQYRCADLFTVCTKDGQTVPHL